MYERLVPQGTPAILITFIVIIETIRKLIRPGTLAVPLTAIMNSGHPPTINHATNHTNHRLPHSNNILLLSGISYSSC